MTGVMVHAANPIVRAGLESIIRATDALLLVGTSSDAIALVQQMELAQPDVLLLEWSATDDDPVSENLLFNGSYPATPAMVVLSDNADNDWVSDALLKGVRALLPRSATASEIVTTVVAVAAGLVVLHPDVIDSLLPRNESTIPALRRSLGTSRQALTPREIEVLGMLAEGLGNKTIAKRLSISEHTVKFHVSSIFQKLSASTRTEAVTIGARQGLIML